MDIGSEKGNAEVKPPLYSLSLSSSKARLETLVAKGNKSARGVLKQLEEPEKFLSTIQIGITLIGIVSGAYGGVAIADDLVPLYPLFRTLVQNHFDFLLCHGAFFAFQSDQFIQQAGGDTE